MNEQNMIQDLYKLINSSKYIVEDDEINNELRNGIIELIRELEKGTGIYHVRKVMNAAFKENFETEKTKLLNYVNIVPVNKDTYVFKGANKIAQAKSRNKNIVPINEEPEALFTDYYTPCYIDDLSDNISHSILEKYSLEMLRSLNRKIENLICQAAVDPSSNFIMDVATENISLIHDVVMKHFSKNEKPVIVINPLIFTEMLSSGQFDVSDGSFNSKGVTYFMSRHSPIITINEVEYYSCPVFADKSISVSIDEFDEDPVVIDWIPDKACWLANAMARVGVLDSTKSITILFKKEK